MSTDLAVMVADEAALDRLDRESVVALLERGKSWLQLAVERDAEVSEFVEAKAQAETIRTYTLQKQLGKDAELAASELVRRAERGIGLAIRRGQEAGEITNRSTAAQQRERSKSTAISEVVVLPRPRDFASPSELGGNEAGIYDLTDAVSDEHFETAIAEAKAEGNLSRANVVRKVKGKPAETTPAPTRVTRPDILRGTHHHNVNRIVEETAHSLAGLCMGIKLARPLLADLDMSQRDTWVALMRESLRNLSRFARELEQL